MNSKILSTLAAFAAVAANAAAPSAGVTPFTFCGRVVDASHAAFDETSRATVLAYDESTNLIAAVREQGFPEQGSAAHRKRGRHVP